MNMKPYLVCHSVNGRKFVDPKVAQLSDYLYFYMQAEDIAEVEYYCPPGEIVFVLAEFGNSEDARKYCDFLRESFQESLDKPLV